MRLIPSMLLGAGLLGSSAAPLLAQSTIDPTPQAVTAPVTPPVTQTASASIGSQVAAASHIVLRLQERRLYLYRDDMLVSSYPVAVGTDETPTPQGQFAISQMVIDPVWQSPWTGEVHDPGPNSALGLRWIQFAASDEGVFGFHGTPTIDSIGKAASNGCVRMRNEDVVALFSQVSVGTAVTVQQ
jgi:lipoprotein-anchoring transpeptidase ErfK/SrfK